MVTSFLTAASSHTIIKSHKFCKCWQDFQVSNAKWKNINNFSSWNKAFLFQDLLAHCFWWHPSYLLSENSGTLVLWNPRLLWCIKFDIPKLRYSTESWLLSLLSPGDLTLHHGEFPYHEFLVKSWISLRQSCYIIVLLYIKIKKKY